MVALRVGVSLFSCVKLQAYCLNYLVVGWSLPSPGVQTDAPADPTEALAPSPRTMADDKAGAARHRSVREDLPLLAIDTSGRWFALVHAGELRLLPLVASPAAAPVTPPLSTSAVECVRFDRTGALLLSGGGDKVVRLWDTATRTCTRSWTHGKKIACVEFSADGGVAMWADRFGEVYVVSLREPDAEPTLALGHLSPVSHLRLTPCGTALLTADREGHVRNSVWPHPFVINNYYLGHTLPLQMVLPMASSPLLVTCATGAGDICVWRLQGGALLHQWTAEWLQRACEGREGEPTPAAEEPPAAVEGGAVRGGLEVACECAGQRLIAVGFATAALHLCELRCEADGSDVKLAPLPALTLTLPAPAIAAETTAAGSLCVLVPGEVIIFPPSASRGFDQAQAVRVPLGSHATAEAAK